MSVVGFQPVNVAGATYIVQHLRPRDRREIYALRWDDDDDPLIDELCRLSGDLWNMWSVDGEPAAICGVFPVRPGVVVSGAFGTEKWPFVVRSMMKWGQDFAYPCLRNSNFHRGEAYVMASNTDTRRWVERFWGGEIEALLKGYGRKREDFLLYAWDLTQERSEHVLRRRRRRIERSANGDRARV